MLLETVSDFDESEVVLIAVNQGEPVSEVSEFIDYFDLVDLTVALDEKKWVGSMYDVKGMPHTVVIDAAGFVRDVSVGFSPFQGTDLKRLLVKLLRKNNLNEHLGNPMPVIFLCFFFEGFVRKIRKSAYWVM